MVTRKPVPSSWLHEQTHTSHVASEGTSHHPLPLEEIEYDWDTCDEVPASVELDLSDSSNSKNLIMDSPPNPGHVPWEDSGQLDLTSQDSGDFGFSNISLGKESNDHSCPPMDKQRNSNPFRRPSTIPSGLSNVNAHQGQTNEKQDLSSSAVSANKLNQEHPATVDTGSSLEKTLLASDQHELNGTPAEKVKRQVANGKTPIVDISQLNMPSVATSTSADNEEPQPKAGQQRPEVYMIKHIRWYDADNTSSYEVIRHSPILTQNSNGPCPLLALVNALVLSTPANLVTPLLENLRTREQISLGLLIDAVFDELMSERRSGNSLDLPDVGELYSFLVSLHKGMNVNPRFVFQSSGPGVPVGAPEELPGFEITDEMKLYGTFKIPLLHGWIPHRHEPVYGAFERLAPTYEEAQNVQFREEELRQMINTKEFTPEDKGVLDDLTLMKQFLRYWPTQLTGHGLDIIQKSLKPGQIAILFRNDHFSTLYKEPRNHHLMTLVTDAGYATHDEIVWESLVDINGSSSEWYSGDFRSVSHNAQRVDLQDQDGWTSVSGKGKRPQDKYHKDELASETHSVCDTSYEKKEKLVLAGISEDAESATLSNRQRTASEQEDMDLALALQLQEEEEEERERREAASRRARENDLSQQYISRQAAEPRTNIAIPPRRSGLTREASQPSSQPSQRSDEDNEEPAPPSYQEAAAERPFLPPQNHPSSNYAPRVQGSAYTENASVLGQVASPAARRRLSRRESLVNQTPPEQSSGIPRRSSRIETGLNSPHIDRKEGCLVM